MAGGLDGDGIWQAMDGDGSDHAIFFGINYRDRAGLSVDDVDFVAFRIDGKAGWIGADLKGAVLAKVDEVENADCVGCAVTDVGKLSIAGGDLGKLVAMAAGEEHKAGSDGVNVT